MRRLDKPKRLNEPVQRRVVAILRPSAADGAHQEFKLRELLKSLNGTAQSARTSWLFFVSFMAYLFVAVASVTHFDLLTNSGTKLPLLQIEIPLGSFFLVSPLLLILTHYGVLLHHAVLQRKARALNSSLSRAENGATRDHEIRLEISSYFFAQDEVGPRRSFILGTLLNAMALLTLNILPLLLLLYFQVTYLPAHDAAATWLHRAYVMVDVVVLTLIACSSITEWRLWGLFDQLSIKNPSFSIVSCVLAIFFSLCVATLPSGSFGYADLDDTMSSLLPTKVPFDRNGGRCVTSEAQRCAFWLTSFLFEQPVDYVSSRRPAFSRSLVVTEKAAVDPGNTTTPKLSLRGRDLRYATFDRSDLRNADLTAADMSGASLHGTDLRGAIFGCAVRGKKLSEWTDPSGARRSTWEDDETCASLQGANLNEAKLSDKSINRALVSRSLLTDIDFTGFDLRGVDFSNASLSRSKLAKANLSSATLSGANLTSVQAEAASFYGANLRGADLSSANMSAGIFTNADLSGADLSGAVLVGSDLRQATFFGANLTHIRIWGAAPPNQKAFALAVLTELNMAQPTELQLTTIREIATSAGSFPIDEDSALPVYNTELLSPQAWTNSDDEKAWLALSNYPAPSDKSAKRKLGNYLGELGCANRSVLNGILTTHLLPPSYSVYDYSVLHDVVRPEGISQQDLATEERPSPAVSKVKRKWTKYYEHGELVTAFIERLQEKDCTKQLDRPNSIIRQLKAVASNAKLGDDSADLRIVVFEP
jgi:uncharacterized protein YjbI with pentapeptide repeats